jgi:acetyl-CoA acetyltransferase
MREAVIVSTARTPIGKAYRGAFNDTQAQALGGHAIREAVKRAGIEPGEVEDVVMGAALQQGSTGRQHRPTGGPACRAADHGRRPEHGPAMRLRPHGDRDGR